MHGSNKVSAGARGGCTGGGCSRGGYADGNCGTATAAAVAMREKRGNASFVGAHADGGLGLCLCLVSGCRLIGGVIGKIS